MSPRRNADSGSYEAVGSQKWFIKSIAWVAAAAILLIGGWTVRRIDKLETAVEAHEKAIGDVKSKVEQMTTKFDLHQHPQDTAIADLKRRMDRIEYPRPWESRQPKGGTP